MFINKYSFLLIAIILFCGGCAGSYKRLPGVDIPSSKLNKDLQLLNLPGNAENIVNNNLFGFHIKNMSDSNIVFPGDYGVKIFTKQNDEWTPVQNNMSYPETDNFLPTTDHFLAGRVVDIQPFIPELQGPVTIRVVVVGHKENHPEDRVGAYLDVLLNP
jgi:hypothetical protein